jgi:hypothetical protein
MRREDSMLSLKMTTTKMHRAIKYSVFLSATIVMFITNVRYRKLDYTVPNLEVERDVNGNATIMLGCGLTSPSA